MRPSSRGDWSSLTTWRIGSPNEKEFVMVLLMFAVAGGLLGYWLGTTRRGYVTVAAVSIGSAALQIGHLLRTSDRSSMTMLPLVVGTVVVASMLIGGLAKRRAPQSTSA
jgi:hypothetical protein